ncbi:MAG: PAS-domain containing protein [Hyphomicrobiales bacterium]|nr:PAS-domain containing protein [Hyphomicrobiales bacterium]
MPDTIRIGGERQRAHPRRSGVARAVLLLLSLLGPAARANAAADAANIAAGRLAGGPLALAEAYLNAFALLDRHAIATVAITLSVLCFAVVTAILLLRTRRRLAEVAAKARDEIIASRAEVDRVYALLRSEPQVLVAWAAADDTPEIIGDVGLVTDAETPHRVLAFGLWLGPEPARTLEAAVANLRERGEKFAMAVTTLAGRPIEAEGQVVGGRAILRLKDVSGAKRELAELLHRFQRQVDDTDALRTLAEALPAPIWARDEAGKLISANPAYARAVDAKDGSEAVRRGIELFDHADRADLFRAHETAQAYTGRLPAIVAGGRVAFDVLSVPTRRGSAGIAIDATEVDVMRAELKRLVDAHRRTLDYLATGVAIFGADQRLTFYNAAFRSLWDLDVHFLDQGPSDSAVLDRLRDARRLPEQHDFRKWKSELQQAYRATEAKTHEWHLPSGRTLRVVTTPNPEGGVIYLYDDITEPLDLQRRFEALIRVQGETLDNLAEAVAVFGSDGRLRLFNPVFAKLWKFDPAALQERPHIEAVIAWCHAIAGDNPIWSALRTAVTAIDDRQPVSGDIERRDGTMVKSATVPLPDGATLVTFQDITDSINVERALRERNEALEEADKIKIDFVHHVSYELRSPLTNIIGFAHFLGDRATGPLNDKQREYLSYITTSTNALLAIINNILDLATIDAGAMTLNLGPVDIRKTMDAAAEGVQDRLEQSDIALSIRTAPDIGSFVADERRVRQALFNLLANAIGFSPPGGLVTLAAQRLKDAVVFLVTDQGPGIPPEVKDKVFDWFETHSLGSRHRGTGLGLSLVRSFVELHGGSVTIDSALGRGTTVTCIFPAEPAVERVNAA